jgi:hypothetical protein
MISDLAFRARGTAGASPRAAAPQRELRRETSLGAGRQKTINTHHLYRFTGAGGTGRSGRGGCGCGIGLGFARLGRRFGFGRLGLRSLPFSQLGGRHKGIIALMEARSPSDGEQK